MDLNFFISEGISDYGKYKGNHNVVEKQGINPDVNMIE